MKRGKRAVWGMLMLLAVTGCAGVGTITSNTSAPKEQVVLTPELRSLYRDVAMQLQMVTALDGYADVYLKTPHRDSKAYCTVQMQRSRDARLIVTAGIFGWPVADMLIRPDSLFVHDMLNNRLLVGKNSGENMEKIIGVQAGFGQMTETLFGITALAEPESSILSVREGDGKISYTVRSGEHKKELLVNRDTKMLEAMMLFDASGHKSIEFRFSDFQTQPAGEFQVKVPRVIDMILYKPDETASTNSLRVVYDERVINPPDFRITFRKPTKAKLVNLDDIERMPWM